MTTYRRYLANWVHNLFPAVGCVLNLQDQYELAVAERKSANALKAIRPIEAA